MADEVIKISFDISDIDKNAKQAASSFDEVSESADKMQKNVNEGAKKISFGLKELQKQLRDLESIRLGELDPKVAADTKKMIAEIKNEITAYRKEMKSMSADAIPQMINGLRGIVAGSQAVVASLNLFGVESEKLQKSMLSLINASMALTTVYDLYEKKTIQTAAATAKDTLSKISNTVATKAMTLATNASTTATKGLYTVIAANPIGAVVVAVAALTAGIIYLANRTDAVGDSMRRFNDAQKKTIDNIAKEMTELKVYTERLKDTNLSQTQRKEIIEELNKKYPGYISNMEQERIIAGESVDIYDRLAGAIRKTAEMQAMKEVIYEAYKKIMQNEMKLVQMRAKEEERSNESILWSITKTMALYKPIVEAMGESWEKSDLLDNISNANAEIDAFTKKLADQTTASDKSNQSLGAAGGAFGKLSGVIKENTKAVKANNDETRETILRMMTMLELARMNEEMNKKAAQELAKMAPYIIQVMFGTSQEKTTKEIEDRVNENFDTFVKRTEEMTSAGIAPKDTLFAQMLGSRDEILAYANQMAADISAITSNLHQAQTNELDATQKEQTQRLEAEYERRLIAAGNNAYNKKQVEEWYTDESTKLTAKLTKQQEELERKQKQQQQRWAIAQAIINGAQGVTKIWANNPEPISAAALTALLTAVVATQIKAISSQKFEKGGQGVIGGKYHSDGGVRFFGGEAEKDERWAIFNRMATQRNSGLPDLIDAINAHQLVIDSQFMKKMDGGGGNNIIVNSTFKGGEHLKAIRELMERGGGDIMLPDGRVKKGIIKRRLN